MHYSERSTSFSLIAKRSGVYQLWTENTLAIRLAFCVFLERAFLYSNTGFPQCFIAHKIITQVGKHADRPLFIAYNACNFCGQGQYIYVFVHCINDLGETSANACHECRWIWYDNCSLLPVNIVILLFLCKLMLKFNVTWFSVTSLFHQCVMIPPN